MASILFQTLRMTGREASPFWDRKPGDSTFKIKLTAGKLVLNQLEFDVYVTFVHVETSWEKKLAGGWLIPTFWWLFYKADTLHLTGDCFTLKL